MRSNHRHGAAAVALAAVFAALVLLVPVLPAVAADGGVKDWNDPGDPLMSAVGLHYGRIGGHGLSFRLPVKWWLYLQASGGLWHTGDHKQHNFGFEANYILRQDQTLRLFLAAGAGYFYDKEKTDTIEGVDQWDTETHWNYGFGVGVELLQGRRWAFLLEGNFFHDGKSGNTTVTPQAGIYYYW